MNPRELMLDRFLSRQKRLLTNFLLFCKQEWRYLLVSGLILIVAAAARIYSLGESPVWFDEAVYALNSRGSLTDLFDQTRSANSSPLALPFILWLLQEHSDSEFLMRLPSAVAGIGVVAVVLLLPGVGVPRPVSLATAVILAASASQIRYSQEVREYELGVFVVALLVYFALKFANEENPKGGTRIQVGLSATLALAPWVSYGAVIAGIAILVGSGLVAPGRRAFISTLQGFYPSALIFGASSFASFWLVARHQIYVLDAPHLGNLYPPLSSAREKAEWLIHSSADFFVFLTGWVPIGQIFALGIALVGSLLMIRVIARPQRISRPYVAGFGVVYLAFLVLLALLMAASFTGLYTFGGSRQLLFAAPLLVLASTWSLYLLFAEVSEVWSGAAFIGVLAVLLNTTGASVYAERDEIDIRAAYGRALDIAAAENLAEDQVWVDSRAWQMVAFYERESNLNIADLMSSEGIRTVLGAENIDALIAVFTRTDLDKLEVIVENLRASGYVVETETLVSSGLILVHAP